MASGVATLGTNKAATHLARRSAQRLAAKNAGKTAGKNALKTPKPTPKTAPNTGKVKPCPPNSFEASTPVLMCDGTQVAIEELEEDDLVWARDVLSGEERCEAITQTFVHEDADLLGLTLRSELSGEYERLVLTHDHPMLSPDGEEVEAYTLRVDDLLGGRYDDFVVVALEPLELVLPVYNLSVAHAHTFFVGDAAVWVHNCPDDVYLPLSPEGKTQPLQKQRVKDQDLPLPDPKADGFPHSTIGSKVSSKNGKVYRQTAEFNGSSYPKANGQDVPFREVHWSDHGRSGAHANPHQHGFTYERSNNTWTRGKNKPFSWKE